METTTAHPPGEPELTRSQLQLDGSHSTAPLTEAVRRGEKLRLRRGVYLDVSVWCGAYPWERHLLATGAHALWQPASIFCRETALALYGVPLLRSPEAVHVRTDRPQQVGLRRPTPLAGRAPGHVVRDILAKQVGPGGRALAPRDLAGLSTRRILLPEPAPRVGSWWGAPVGAAAALWVESLDAVVADTLPRMAFEEAVVALDALRAGRHRGRSEVSWEDVRPWEGLIPSHRAHRRWDAAWEMSDPAAESPGESLSRVRMSEAGLLMPESQKTFDLPGGRARVDFWWPELRLVGEFDGKVKYTRGRDLRGVDVAEIVYEEKVREDQLRARGLGVVRWGWQVARGPSALARVLVAAGVPQL